MYSDESKNEALKLIQVGEKIDVIAKKTLISSSTLYRWKKESDNKYTIIRKNILIGKLITQFQSEWLLDKDKANNTMQKITGLIEECLKVSPNDLYTIGYAIKAAKLRNDFSEAINLLKRRLELVPNNAIAIQELKRLQQVQNEEKYHQEKIDKEKFFALYKKLKNDGDIEKLETLLREKILEYPDDLIMQNQLATVLLDKLSQNINKPDLISEIKNILLKLNELSPNNLRVKSNLIRLNKLCCNEKSMEVMLRESIVLDSGNYKAKSQLAQLLIEKSKAEAQTHELQEYNLNEATSLTHQVLKKFPDNHYALGQLIEIARLKRDLSAQEILLRRTIELNPDNTQLKTRLAGTLIEQCVQKVSRDGTIAKYDTQLIEAKQILLKVFELQPKNLYVITYLIRVAHLQSYIREAISLLKLKISIDPKDIQAQENLHNLEEKVRLKSNNKFVNNESKKINLTDQIPIDYFTASSVETTASTDTQPKVASTAFVLLYSNLMEALDKGWDRQLVSEILNEMSKDVSIGDKNKKQIRDMIEKTKSRKTKMRFVLRGQALILSKKLY